MKKREKRYIIALDAGGTMTDTFLADEEGNFCLGKALTNHKEEYKSYIESTADAASHWNITNADIHRAAENVTYSGTTMLNLLLTRSGAKVGLLTTKGFKENPFNERGLTWVGLSSEDIMHSLLHRHTEPLVHKECVKEVSERIKGPTWFLGLHVPPGTVVIPLNENEVRRGTEELLDEGVEIIGILFISSYMNNIHEKKAAEIAREVVKKRGLNVPVVTSSSICPVAFENARLKTLLFHCYMAEPAREKLDLIEQAAKKNGYQGELQVELCHGARANIRYPRLHEAITSGPTGGLLGVWYLTNEVLKLRNVVACDLGGTTFDVGVIARGQLPVNVEPSFGGHRLRLPMLAIDSIGAGTGTRIHATPEHKRIELGPESAGSLIGTCYNYPHITIGDVDLVLGYLNPDYFLGGKIKLNKKAALKALEEQLAKPLGLDVYKAASSTLELLHSGLRDHISGAMLSRGHRSEEYTLICYGGSGALHLWGIEEAINFAGVYTCPWAAAFSAFGVAASDYFYRYQETVMCVLPSALPDEAKLEQAQLLNEGWERLERQALADFSKIGVSEKNVTFNYAILGRYLGQMFSWEAQVQKGRVETITDLRNMIQAFERTYLSIYPEGARMPEAGYSVTEIILKAKIETTKPVIREYPLGGKTPPKKAYKGMREVFHEQKWIKFDLWEMDLLEAGNKVDGPAIVEHPMTTLVIPPNRYAEVDNHKLIAFKRK